MPDRKRQTVFDVFNKMPDFAYKRNKAGDEIPFNFALVGNGGQINICYISGASTILLVERMENDEELNEHIARLSVESLNGIDTAAINVIGGNDDGF